MKRCPHCGGIVPQEPKVEECQHEYCFLASDGKYRCAKCLVALPFDPLAYAGNTAGPVTIVSNATRDNDGYYFGALD